MIGVIVALLLLAVGAAETVAGVFMLFGQGWGFVAAGLFTIAGGVVVARGLSS